MRRTLTLSTLNGDTLVTEIDVALRGSGIVKGGCKGHRDKCNSSTKLCCTEGRYEPGTDGELTLTCRHRDDKLIWKSKMRCRYSNYIKGDGDGY